MKIYLYYYISDNFKRKVESVFSRSYEYDKAEKFSFKKKRRTGRKEKGMFTSFKFVVYSIHSNIRIFKKYALH